MQANVAIIKDTAGLKACFNAFQVLRPHLNLDDFLSQVERQQGQGYQVLALYDNGSVVSVAGFRFSEFLAWGKVLYIDDLSTLPEVRSKGFGEQLLTWLISHAKDNGCQGIHLDTGYGRHDAHRLYLKKGFLLSSHHMSQVF
jgi:GNAT superfamily N-acetyltransferase